MPWGPVGPFVFDKNDVFIAGSFRVSLFIGSGNGSRNSLGIGSGNGSGIGLGNGLENGSVSFGK